MIVYTGKDLDKYLQSVHHFPQTRDCMTWVTEYMHSDNPCVLCLYGLRRTGETVLMQQTMIALNASDSTVLISCEEGDSMYDLRQALTQLEHCRFLFLDEVTRLSNFINTASFLSDYLSAVGKRVCMAGTDSLGFAIAKQDELFDRVEMIHTTYIPYREYHRLLGKDVMDYIRYGGTLTDGEKLYNEDRRTGEYTNSAIVSNITHSLEKWKQGQEYDVLSSMVENNDLSSAIRKVLEAHTGRFLAKTINDSFRSHDKGSLYDLLTKSTDVNPERLKRIADDEIRPFLYIKPDNSTPVSQKAADTIEHYLRELDVVYYDRRADRDIFIQPGMRYAQCMELADALQNNEEFMGYAPTDQRTILDKLESDICGQILEDVVFYQLTRELDDQRYIVSKYRDENGREIDVLVEDVDTGSSIAMEVKLSEIRDPGQWRHLADDAFIKSIENKRKTRISNRVVVYMGDSVESSFGHGIYLNTADLLMGARNWIFQLLDHPNLQLSQLP